MRAYSPVALVAFATMCLQCGGGNARIPTAAAIGVDGSPAAGDDSVADSSVAVSDATSTGGDEAVGSDDAGRMDATPGSKEGGGPASEAGTAPYSPCPTGGSPCKILPLGDSITYGIQYAGAYRVELFQDAQTAHQHITFVGDSSLANGPTTVAGVAFPQDNDGHSGWTIDQIAGLVPSPALQTNPDIVLLMIGTNDMYSTSQPVAQAPQRLAALLDAIIKGDARALLIVAQITPLQNSTWETQVVTYNAAIPALVQARAGAGKHIAMVDMHTGFVTATMLSSDGVHPNQTGYNHMGDVWYAALKDVLH
jgi:lysophospholipase L1-like esterase